MKIVIAPDSFKESLSAAQVAAAIALGVKDACRTAHIHCIPMADGGEGTVAAVVSATGGQWRHTWVHGALDQELQAAWAWLDPDTAIIEAAASTGLALTPTEQRQPLRASSYGLGQLILAALNAGARRIILGLGGSSCTDGGAGMLSALGIRFLDANGESLAPGGGALNRLAHLDSAGLDKRLANTLIEVASDVDNPLCGPQGAAVVFGPQKGADPAEVATLDANLTHFADVCARHLSHDHRHAPGAGAAGGLGFACHAFLKARFRPGVELIAELNGLHEAVQGATLVFTGEGRLDAQTLHGKTPAGVARIAQSAGVPVIALAGSLGPGYEALHEQGVTAAFSLTSGPMSLQQAYEQAAALLQERARDVMQVWMAAAKRRL